MGTIREIRHEECTGCGACYNKCPHNAIRMEYDSEGFLFPVIDDTLCVDCGLCLQSCAVKNPQYNNNSNPECYAMWADDEIRMVSSSGGMFTVLANYVLEKDGYVCGAAYTDDYTAVEHIVISDKNDLPRLRGSKYVQSNTLNVYSEIKTLLDENKDVLFSGCPCQVAGLYSYLDKEYPKLITVDIVCHGAPSPVAYKKYLENRRNGRVIEKVNFREKDVYGWGTPATICFNDGSVYRNDCSKDLWYRAFLNGVNTRFCCGECRYASPKRIGDITLGDFWGIKEIDASLDDNKGTSLVFLNSEKSKTLYHNIKSNLKKSKQINFDDVIELAKRRNGQLMLPRKNHQARNRFFKLLHEKTYDDAFNFAVNYRYDVGITGWWYNDNYGGALTYYALHQVVQNMGLSVLMIAKASKSPDYKPNVNAIPYRFALKHYDISETYHPNELGKLNAVCKNFISGSDQLFNPTLWAYSGPQYFLDYVDPLNNRIAYGSSFGNGYVANDDFTMKASYWLRRFDYLSVREDYAVDIMREQFGLEAKHVLDPVFLCDVKEYEKLAETSKAKTPQKYILSFFLDPNEEKRKAILELAEYFDMPYVNLVHAADIDENVKKLNLDNTKGDADIEDWLYYYKNASFVITDSYHGTCFAIIFQKPFISVANLQRGAKRFESLLRATELTERLTYNIEEILQRTELLQPVDYERVAEILQPKIEDNYNWLKNALTDSHKNGKDVFKVTDRRMTELKLEILRLQQVIEQQNREIRKLQNGQNSESIQDTVVKTTATKNKTTNVLENIHKTKDYYQKFGFKKTVTKVVKKVREKH